MANIIKPKRSNTASAVPTTGQLASGELAVNMADKKVYINNGTSVVQVGAGNLSALGDANISAPSNGQSLTYDTASGKWVNTSAGTGTVTSVGMTVPTGLSVSGSPVTNSGTLAVELTAGYSIPTTASQTNWNTAYSDRLKWDGGSTGLVAATGRTSLGGTTVGQNFFTLTNPSAITFPRINADNTVSALDAATFRSAIGAGTSSTTGTVTSVGGTGTVSGLTLTGTVTTSGNLTLGGTLAVTPGNFASQTANTILAAPNGSAGVPTFRILASADIPSLDASKITTGVFDAARLPSYVDDVLEYANLAAFPATGTTGKIYIALDTNKTYRWSGTVYVYITSGAVDSVGGATGVVTATNLLDSIKTVDGAASGLDADLLDGNHASAFYLATNPSGYISGITSGMVTTALGYTPLSNATSYLPLSGGQLSGDLQLVGNYLRFDQSGVRSWNLRATGGNLDLASGDALGSFRFNGSAVLHAGNYLAYPQTRIVDAGGSGKFLTLNSSNELEFYNSAGTAIETLYIQYSGANDSLRGPGGNTILHAGNYTSYSPSLTGSGASGTWGISVTGNAATASNASQLNGKAASAFSGPDSVVRQYFWDTLAANGSQARTFEIARLGIDYNDWNGGTGPFEVELYEKYFSRGLKKKYVIHWGYTNTYGIQLVEYSGSGDNTFQVRIGTPVQVSGDNYYLPVYVDVRYYGQVDVRVTTNRTPTTSNPPGVGSTYINATPSPTNISDFTPDSTVNFSSVSTVQVAGNQLLHAGNYTSYSPSLTGTGASGIWGISISGNAATATTASGVSAGVVSGKTIYDNFTATASQTTFTTSVAYTSGKIEVFANGVKMVNAEDVTVTSGTQVVFASGLAVNTKVTLVYPI